MRYRIRGLMLLSLLAMGLLAACQAGSPAMDAAATAAAPVGASAEESTDSDGLAGQSPAADNASAADDNGEGASNRCRTGKPHPQIGKLAAEFDVSEAVIAGYLCDDGLSPGAIRNAYRIAGQGGETVDAVLALRASGLGWGQIRGQLGLTPGDDADDDADQEIEEQDDDQPDDSDEDEQEDEQDEDQPDDDTESENDESGAVFDVAPLGLIVSIPGQIHSC